ncbi:hypothetical protein Lal_00032575 [Lupinus albus]|nr:hypothetical protein Lal_00032575 [Lupinus albus]
MASESADNEVVSQTLDTQKRTPCGITSIKNIIRARSNNVKLLIELNTKSQPLNTNGGNTFVSYIGVVVMKNVSITFSSWTHVMLNSVKKRIWTDITTTFDVGEEHKHYILKYDGKAL